MDQLRSFFSSYLPFNSLLQYIFQRVLGSYIKNDINISNFALGTTILRDLPLDQEKITEKFLKGTCLSLIDGKIGKFNLKIPWTSILQDSIEVGIEDMELNLSINIEKINSNSKKKLEKNIILNTAMDEKLEALYDNKVDIFKKIISKILLNMKIELKNLKIRLFFNFGVFKINVGEIKVIKKKEEKVEKHEKLMNSLLIEELENYFLEINQISVFLAESLERLSHDEYSNKKSLKSLSINHPKCICTILEQSIRLEAKRKKNSDELKYVKIFIPPIEMMFEPYQISLLSDFFDDFIIQQRNYTKNLNNIEELSKKRSRIQEIFDKSPKKEDPNINRCRSSSLVDPSNNINSISPEKLKIPRKLSIGSDNFDGRPTFSFADLKVEEKDEIQQNEDFISTIINDYFSKESKEANELKNLAEDVRKNENNQGINKSTENEIDLFLSAKIEEDHTPLVFEAEISRLIIYILKIDFDTNQKDHYARDWRFFQNNECQGKKEKFNYKIPTSFFQIELKNVIAKFCKMKFEETTLKVRKLRILDIDLINEMKFPNVLLKKNENLVYLQKNKPAAPVINQFSPEDSVIFHSIENSISLSFLRTKELQRNLNVFKLSKNQHYCAFYILNISDKKIFKSSSRTFFDEYSHLRFAINSINQTKNSVEAGSLELKLSKKEDANKLRITVPDINLSISSKLIGDTLSIMNLIKNKKCKKNESNNLNLNELPSLKKSESEKKTKFKCKIKLGCVKIGLFSFKDEKLDIDLNDSNAILNPIKENVKNTLYSGHSYFCHCEDIKSQFLKIKFPCLYIFCEKIQVKCSEEIKACFENLEFGTSDEKFSSILGKFINFAVLYKKNNIQEACEADAISDNLMQNEEKKNNDHGDNIIESFNENKLLMRSDSLQNIFLGENIFDITVESMKFHFFIPFLLTAQLFLNEFLSILAKYILSNEESNIPPICTKLNIAQINIFLNENNTFPINNYQIPNNYEQSQKLDISIYQSTIMDFQPQRVFFNFEINEEYIKKNIEESFMIILDDFNLAAQVKNKITKIYFNLDDFLLIDGKKKNIHMDCPLKLVRGVKRDEMKKNIPYQSKIIVQNYFDKVLIYKQASFWNSEEFSKTIENKNAFIQLKSEMKDDSLDVEVAIQGMVFRPDLRLYQLDRLINFLDHLNLRKEKKEIEKKKNVMKSQSNLRFKLNFYNIAIDLHPYYEKFDIEQSPALFHFKMTDLDFDKNGFFYANSRSLILINDFVIEGNQKNQEKLIFSIQLKNLKYCLLQHFDFEARNNPLLLFDFEEKLNKYYDSLVQSLGFINILEVNGIKVENNLERIQIKINKINLNIAEDSLKALILQFEMISLNLKKINSRLKAVNDVANDKKIKKEAKIEKFELDLDEFSGEKERRNSFTIIDEAEILKEEIMEKEHFKKAEIFENHCNKHTFHQDRKNDEKNLFTLEFELFSFDLCIFGGKDFDFELTTPPGEEHYSKSSYERRKEGLEILPEYFISGHESKNLNKTKRKRNSKRNNNDSIKLTGSNIIAIFRMLDLKEQNNKNMARITFSIQELELLDAITNSANNKIICKVQINPTLNQAQEFTYIQIEIYQRLFEDKAIERKNLEFQIHVKQHPLRIYLNGINLNFLLNLLQKEDLADREILFNEYLSRNENHNFSDTIDYFASQKNFYSKDFSQSNFVNLTNVEKQKLPKCSPESNIFFSLINIQEFYILFDYDAVYENLSQVFENKLQIINIGNIKDLELNFKTIILRGEEQNEIVDKIINIWKNDIIYFQKPNIIKRLPYLHNAFNLIEGVTNLFYLPFCQIKIGGDVEKGMLMGIKGFTKAVKTESMNLTEAVANTLTFGFDKIGLKMKRIPKYIENVKKILDPDESKKFNEKYKKN